MAANGTDQEPHSPKDARLTSLDRRLDQLKAEEALKNGRMSTESQRVIRSAGMRILSDLIGLPFGAGLIGWVIDRMAGTTPWVMLAMLFLRRVRPGAIVGGLLCGDVVALGLHLSGWPIGGLNPGFVGLLANGGIMLGATRLWPGAVREPVAARWAVRREGEGSRWAT